MSTLVLEPVQLGSLSDDDDELIHRICCADHYKAYCGTRLDTDEWVIVEDADPDDCIVCDLVHERGPHCRVCAMCPGCEACTP